MFVDYIQSQDYVLINTLLSCTYVLNEVTPALERRNNERNAAITPTVRVFPPATRLDPYEGLLGR